MGGYIFIEGYNGKDRTMAVFLLEYTKFLQEAGMITFNLASIWLESFKDLLGILQDSHKNSQFRHEF